MFTRSPEILSTRVRLRSLSMNLLTQPVGLSHYLVVGTILFVCGVVCMAVKRNAVGMLMGIELVLNGANLNFVAFGSPLLRARGRRRLGLDGQLIAMFVIVLAAAEAAVALAIALSYYHNHATIDVDRAERTKGIRMDLHNLLPKLLGLAWLLPLASFALICFGARGWARRHCAGYLATAAILAGFASPRRLACWLCCSIPWSQPPTAEPVPRRP